MTISVRGKLLLGQLPLLLALLVLTVFALATVSSIGDSAQNILQDNYRSVLAAQRMKEAIERMDSGALFVIAGQHKLGWEQVGSHRKRFDQELQIEEANITEVGEAEIARKLRSAWEHYLHQLQRFQSLDDSSSLRQHYFQDLAPAFLQVKQCADEVLGLNQDAMMRKSERARLTAQRLSQSTMLAALAAMGIGILASTYLTTRLVRPLSLLGQAVRRIGKGDLDARAQVSGGDELAQLAKDVNTMAEQLGRYRRSTLGELIQAQQSAQSIMDSLPDPVLLFDESGRILSTNHPADVLLGMDERSEGDPLSTLPVQLRSVVLSVRSHVLSGRGSYVPRDFAEAVATQTAEGDRYLLPRAAPVYDERGAVQGVAVILQDITRLRRFDELKNDLVATVAHEFRTPLTSLRMSIHLCLEELPGPLTEKQTELLFAAREDCERLQAFIDDLLDLAKLQAGRLEMRKSRIPIHQLLQGALAEQSAYAEQMQVQLRIESSLLPLAETEVDPERLSMVFGNLIANAIRHSPVGTVVTVCAEEESARFRFSVRDEGPGIAPDYQREVFHKFFRVPGNHSGAAGLGLSIAKEIVEAHGGEIGVQSEPGHGATFYFFIPKREPAQ
ncbi:MAG: ATP-binding protein [Polyangia bacterium]|jgi:signal transduction histidine kinase